MPTPGFHSAPSPSPTFAMQTELLVLRVLHVMGGIFWLGSGLFTSYFLTPAIGAVGPAGGQVMAELQKRHLFTILPAAALLTMLSGARLLWIVSGGFTVTYLTSRTGATYLWSGVATIVGFLIALIFTRPAMVKAGQLAAARAQAPAERQAEIDREVIRLRVRASAGTKLAMALLVVGGLGMAVARYL